MTWPRSSTVRWTEEELIVYGLALEELARHRLLPSSVTRQRQLTAEHRPPENRRQQDEQLRESFAEFGEAGVRFWNGRSRTAPTRLRRSSES